MFFDIKKKKKKARIDSKHEILEIGCGWGTLAIEVVKRTGCRYTGITLSEEQLKYAQKRVKDAGLEVLYFLKLSPLYLFSNIYNYKTQSPPLFFTYIYHNQ